MNAKEIIAARKAIEVTEVDATVVHINGKEVRQDMNGNWVAAEELTRSEYIAFKQWKKNIGHED